MISGIKKFYLKEHEWKLILEHCSSLCLDKKMTRENNTIVLTLDTSEQTCIVDKLLDLFVSIGLEKNYEPNKIGLQIESLIDIFNPYR